MQRKKLNFGAIMKNASSNGGADTATVEAPIVTTPSVEESSEEETTETENDATPVEGGMEAIPDIVDALNEVTGSTETEEEPESEPEVKPEVKPQTPVEAENVPRKSNKQLRKEARAAARNGKGKGDNKPSAEPEKKKKGTVVKDLSEIAQALDTKDLPADENGNLNRLNLPERANKDTLMDFVRGLKRRTILKGFVGTPNYQNDQLLSWRVFFSPEGSDLTYWSYLYLNTLPSTTRVQPGSLVEFELSGSGHVTNVNVVEKVNGVTDLYDAMVEAMGGVKALVLSHENVLELLAPHVDLIEGTENLTGTDVLELIENSIEGKLVEYTTAGFAFVSQRAFDERYS